MARSLLAVMDDMWSAFSGVVVLGCAPLSGCALVAGDIADAGYNAAFRTKIEDTATLSADELRDLTRVQIYSANTGLTYTSVGQIESLSCRETTRWIPALSEINGRTPEEAAMTQLKVKAIKAGGNAILAPTCVHHSKMDWGNNCFASWICTGVAIRLEQ